MLPRTMAGRHSRAFWVKAVAQIERGANAGEVAARLGVNVSTLRWWRSELRRSAPEPVRVLPVEVEPAPAPDGARVELRLASGDVISFEPSTAPAYVAALAAALRASC